MPAKYYCRVVGNEIQKVPYENFKTTSVVPNTTKQFSELSQRVFHAKAYSEYIHHASSDEGQISAILSQCDAAFNRLSLRDGAVILREAQTTGQQSEYVEVTVIDGHQQKRIAGETRAAYTQEGNNSEYNYREWDDTDMSQGLMTRHEVIAGQLYYAPISPHSERSPIPMSNATSITLSEYLKTEMLPRNQDSIALRKPIRVDGKTIQWVAREQRRGGDEVLSDIDELGISGEHVAQSREEQMETLERIVRDELYAYWFGLRVYADPSMQDKIQQNTADIGKRQRFIDGSVLTGDDTIIDHTWQYSLKYDRDIEVSGDLWASRKKSAHTGKYTHGIPEQRRTFVRCDTGETACFIVTDSDKNPVVLMGERVKDVDANQFVFVAGSGGAWVSKSPSEDVRGKQADWKDQMVKSGKGDMRVVVAKWTYGMTIEYTDASLKTENFLNVWIPETMYTSLKSMDDIDPALKDELLNIAQFVKDTVNHIKDNLEKYKMVSDDVYTLEAVAPTPYFPEPSRYVDMWTSKGRWVVGNEGSYKWEVRALESVGAHREFS